MCGRADSQPMQPHARCSAPPSRPRLPSRSAIAPVYQERRHRSGACAPQRPAGLPALCTGAKPSSHSLGTLGQRAQAVAPPPPPPPAPARPSPRSPARAGRRDGSVRVPRGGRGALRRHHGPGRGRPHQDGPGPRPAPRAPPCGHGLRQWRPRSGPPLRHCTPPMRAPARLRCRQGFRLTLKYITECGIVSESLRHGS